MACATTTPQTSFHLLSNHKQQVIGPPKDLFLASSLIKPPRGTRHHYRPISAAYATADRTTTVSPPSTATLFSSSFYDVLGVQDGATCKEIKAAYRKLARTLHPDVVSHGQDCATSADEFIRVHEAYATLMDPTKRADYDKMLFFKRRRLGSSPNYYYSVGSSNTRGTTSYSGFSGYTRRTWETDQCW